MTIGQIKFGPVRVDGEWFVRLEAPGQATDCGPYADQEEAQSFADMIWPKLVENMKEWEERGDINILNEYVSDEPFDREPL